MIPKIIHYCWFSGEPFDEKTRKCIETWKAFCPDYEIRECNAENFDYPINLMFSSSMPIWEGSFADALDMTVSDLKQKGLLR